jgi:hypothetical protein
MTTTFTHTIRDIVTDALLDIEAGRLGTPPAAAEMDLGIRHLNRIMKTWQGNGSQFLRTNGSLTLTTSSSYTLTPPRPIRIITARLKRNGIETPMFRMTRDDYDDLPQKLSTGLPTQYYYDRQKETGTFFVWPVLTAASGETVEFSYEREFEDVTDPDDTIDCPVEWYDAVVLNVAARLSHTFGSADRKALIKNEAIEALNTALGSDTEESVYWRSTYG